MSDHTSAQRVLALTAVACVAVVAWQQSGIAQPKAITLVTLPSTAQGTAVHTLPRAYPLPSAGPHSIVAAASHYPVAATRALQQAAVSTTATQHPSAPSISGLGLLAPLAFIAGLITTYAVTKAFSRKQPVLHPLDHGYGSGIAMAAMTSNRSSRLNAADDEDLIDVTPDAEVAPGVGYTFLAREWRCKWSTDIDSVALLQAQEYLEYILPVLLAYLPEGSQIQRVVCGSCLDFKVIVSVPEPLFKGWEAQSFSPEDRFLEALKGTLGITEVETQTYTIESLTGECPEGSETQELWPLVFVGRMAREVRCKWSEDNDKASLVAAQQALEKVLPALSELDGVQVQRIVCGGCQDFKVITSLPMDSFEAFWESGFGPEAELLAALEGIDGVTQVETQTYTLQPLDQLYGPVQVGGQEQG